MDREKSSSKHYREDRDRDSTKDHGDHKHHRSHRDSDHTIENPACGLNTRLASNLKPIGNRPAMNVGSCHVS
ncbi:hypothetical protein SLEP1_g5639 [Rubroshorea leprosula]|uniref:Uncharacterized protein n=1 Tax=Rubroshorea leprosula TaxID=152421 RepID=A0AAV5I381_9ROSI|nr:hypothetical protein SLEP1_g5639 [Rubroshorea leprosula]